VLTVNDGYLFKRLISDIFSISKMITTLSLITYYYYNL